jgi:hypothetical protein
MAVVCLFPAAASAATPAKDWPTFRGDIAAKGITDTKTPTTAKKTAERWVKEIKPGNDFGVVGYPIIVGSNVYVTTSVGDGSYGPSTNAKLLVFTTKGKLKKTVSLDADSTTPAGITNSPSTLAYGDGKLFIPLNDGTVRALDAKTYKQLWVSKAIASVGSEITGTLQYYDGYLYGGTDSSVGKGGEGFFFALSTKDSNKKKSNEVKNFKWKYQSKSGTGGYYTAGAAFTKKAVIFAGNDGILVSHALKSKKVYSTYNLKGAVQSELVTDGSNVYGVIKSGKLFKVPVKSNGKLDKKKLKTKSLSFANSTTAPVVYNGKVYAISGEMGFDPDPGTGKLDVFKTKNLKKLSTVDLGAYVQSSPLLSAGYATKKNGNTVYLYAVKNSLNDNVLVIKDSSKQKKPKVSTLYKPGGSYGLDSPIADKSGNIYFYHTITDPLTWAYSASLVSLGVKK